MQTKENQTITLLKEREHYFYLAEILQKRYAGKKISKVLTFEYSFVEINLASPLDTPTSEKYWLSVRYSKEFNIWEVRCESEAGQAEVEKMVSTFINSNQENVDSEWFKKFDNEEIRHYVEEADKIAKVGSICGRTYPPFYYSKITISEDKILLEQADYYNSKSLDKENYAMRELFFEIPFVNKQNTDFQPFEIGDIHWYKSMKIHFEDHSSPSYKDCGENIKLIIKELVK
jgi:hypothetical protein